MCRRHLPFWPLIVALALTGCCVEGYPILRERDVAFNEVPNRVREAFEKGYDAREVTRVEHTWMKSVCAEDISKYRFHLRDEQTITLDYRGRLTRWVPGLRQQSATTQSGT